MPYSSLFQCPNLQDTNMDMKSLILKWPETFLDIFWTGLSRVRIDGNAGPLSKYRRAYPLYTGGLGVQISAASLWLSSSPPRCFRFWKRNPGGPLEDASGPAPAASVSSSAPCDGSWPLGWPREAAPRPCPRGRQAGCSRPAPDRVRNLVRIRRGRAWSGLAALWRTSST